MTIGSFQFSHAPSIINPFSITIMIIGAILLGLCLIMVFYDEKQRKANARHVQRMPR